MKFPAQTQQTKIVATYGPSLKAPEVLRAVLKLGVDIIRYNFSHGKPDEFTRLVRTLRRLEHELERPIGILADLQGPKIRTGELADHQPVTITTGQDFFLTRQPIAGTARGMSISYAFTPDEFQPGARILMDDGKIVLRVVRIADGILHCTVEKGGGLRERQGVNFPGTATRLPAMTDKDRSDAAAALAAGVDFLALSFVRQAADLHRLRRLIDAAGTGTAIVAKIEKPQALENLDGILAATDAIMVARGDLGVEVDIERIGVLQKQIIGRCRQAQIPVIVATQMLESMTEQPRPTRAEATDVTNAILDGTDAVMLSGETALGRYPMETVRTMATIAAETERYLRQMPNLLAGLDPLAPGDDPLTAIARAAYHASRDVHAAAITVHTLSGRTARVLSRFRPDCPIVAMTPDPATWRRMSLYYGVHPVRIRTSRTSDHLMEQAESWAKHNFQLEQPAHFVILSGQARSVGATNTLRIATIRPPHRGRPVAPGRR